MKLSESQEYALSTSFLVFRIRRAHFYDNTQFTAAVTMNMPWFLTFARDMFELLAIPTLYILAGRGGGSGGRSGRFRGRRCGRHVLRGGGGDRGSRGSIRATPGSFTGAFINLRLGFHNSCSSDSNRALAALRGGRYARSGKIDCSDSEGARYWAMAS